VRAVLHPVVRGFPNGRPHLPKKTLNLLGVDMESSPSIPKLAELQMAHRTLIVEYVSAIDAGSRLPFFVNSRTLLKPRDEETAYEKFARRFPPLTTPFCWRPFVQLIVESHIKGKLSELNAIYTQFALQLSDKKTDVKLRSLLISLSAECKTLADTLTVWKNSQTLLAGAIPIFLGIMTSWLGTDNLLALFPKISNQLLQVLNLRLDIFLTIIMAVILSVIFLFFLLNSAFEAKRAIFLPYYLIGKRDVAQQNIYASEDRLYKLIRRKKATEFAIDAYAAVASVTIIFIVLIIITAAIPVVTLMPFILLMIVFLVSAIYPSWHRWN
jgi:hypothetical protein